MSTPKLPAAALALAGALLLSGCGGLLPEPAEPPRTIDFGPAAERADAADSLRPIELARVDAPRWLGGEAIHYRRVDTDPTTLRQYARHVWAAPPAELLRAEVERMLQANGARDGSPEARLELRLTRFEQVLTGAGEAHVEARMRARLVRRDDGRVHQRELGVRIDATPDVDGAVTALPRAAHQLVDELGAWLASVHGREGEAGD